MPRTRPRTADINIPQLWGAIVLRHRQTGQSYREIADSIGISDSTFTRLRQAAWGDSHYRPDLRAYLSICRWLERSTEDFIVREEIPASHG